MGNLIYVQGQIINLALVKAIKYEPNQSNDGGALRFIFNTTINDQTYNYQEEIIFREKGGATELRNLWEKLVATAKH